MFSSCTYYSRDLQSAMLLRVVPFGLLALILGAASLPHDGGSGGGAAGTQHQKLKRRGAAGNDDDATPNPSMFGYGCSCYETGPPEKDIKWLKRLAIQEPHPMLTLSELAESMHRSIVCRHCPISINQQGEDDTIKEVTKRMYAYLNITRQHTSQDPCLASYRISFYPKRYPRYLVEVECSGPIEEYASRNPHCSGGSGTVCFPYLYKMWFLSNDPHDPRCPSDNVQSWEKCHISIGVGCSCSTE